MSNVTPPGAFVRRRYARERRELAERLARDRSFVRDLLQLIMVESGFRDVAAFARLLQRIARRSGGYTVADVRAVMTLLRPPAASRHRAPQADERQLSLDLAPPPAPSRRGRR